MAKTILKPWLKESILVEIETTETLTEEEKKEVSKGIRIACSWMFAGEALPSIGEIKQAIEDFNPSLAGKLISWNY